MSGVSLPASALLATAAPGRWEETGGELRDAAKHLKGTVSSSRRNVRDWKRREEKIQITGKGKDELNLKGNCCGDCVYI